MQGLTVRQGAFLDRLLDLYCQEKGPIHYSQLAEKLGVGLTTAYEMLRRLQEKGYAASTFLTRGSGPGRSMVCFYPTAQARERLQDLVAETFNPKQWQRLRAKILSSLAKGRAAQRELLQELLAKIPEYESPLLNSARVMTALLLTLRRQTATRFKQHPIAKIIVEGEPPLEFSLSLLPGLALGISMTQQASRQFGENLLSYAKEYQRHLRRLDQESRQRLLDFLREVIETLEV